MRRCLINRLQLLLATACLGAFATAQAIGNGTLRFDELAAPEWQASNATVTVQLKTAEPAAEVTIRSLQPDRPQDGATRV